jgi:cell division protein FtsL
VQNHPVRELDRVGQRELWWWVLGSAVCVGGLLLLAWQHFQWTQLGYDLDAKRQEASIAEAEARHLRVELATLSAPLRIEQIATTQLHMVTPGLTEAVVLERVREAVAPARTLVARR